MEDSITLVKKEGQTQIGSENNLKIGTTREMPLKHP